MSIHLSVHRRTSYRLFSISALCISMLTLAPGVPAQAVELGVASSFNPDMASGICGLSVDPGSGNIWVYQCSDNIVQRYSSAGNFLGSVNSPGETANDVDLDFTLESMNLDGTNVPNGTLLFINGERNEADIYALAANGAVLADLEADFGVSHVVGGAHHPGRDSIFLVQDRLPGAADENRIGEVDPVDGALLNTYSIGDLFDVNFGDIDVCPSSGNLFVVSSIESRIAELTPEGALVGYHALPGGVSGLTGIAIGPGSEVAYVSGSSGVVYQLSGFPCTVAPPPPPAGDCEDDLGQGVICLLNGRFQMTVTWRNPNAGNAIEAVNLLRFSDTAAEGYFSNANNVEILAKAINGCPVNNNYWVFVGGVTDQNVIIDVFDLTDGSNRHYENPAGEPYQTVADTGAFPCP